MILDHFTVEIKTPLIDVDVSLRVQVTRDDPESIWELESVVGVNGVKFWPAEDQHYGGQINDDRDGTIFRAHDLKHWTDWLNRVLDDDDVINLAFQDACDSAAEHAAEYDEETRGDERYHAWRNGDFER